ncbi:MAG: hypothetical protein B193_1815 [Solidesulfovibrio magneticus str. Maddingley MBC34]|uniref:Uncharacterized protein n=1 Tax=Solidesulfovibrio magneticus str. Maddingley MBC34 TaxID=1206767 RepID=K6GR91_9BACT|nr:MAG: hypothetical protein B193_1815 [Solidesulfovibrio magneticus str. Maddingley MBC34]
MRFGQYLKWFVSGEAGTFLRMSRDMKGYYRMCFLAQAGKHGLLRALADRSRDADELLAVLRLPSQRMPGLKAFLHLGLTLGELACRDGRYSLKGRQSRALAKTAFDHYLGLAEEVSGLHGPYIAAALDHEDHGQELVAVSDAHAEAIVRSSRVAQPLLQDVMDRLVPLHGDFELLEVGSGTGVYLRHALVRNPSLRAVGVERERPIAQTLRDRLLHEGLSERAEGVAKDMRELDYRERFDCITLFNNIYYFPEEGHEALLRLLLSWLKPGGTLAVATLCRDGGYPIDALLHLWSALTPGASVLPDPAAFTSLMAGVGYEAKAVTPSIIDPAMKVFVGVKPHRA